MVWQPSGTSTGSADDDVRVGTIRSSMLQNPLLAKPELGKIKPILFNSPTQDHVFGYAPPKDPEGAREVTMLWADHKKSKAESELRPVTDFKTMNKMAVDCGITTAKDLPSFRASNKVLVKDSPVKKSPATTSHLPSSRNMTHTYGTPPGHRSPECVRSHGPMEPPVKHLVQGAYQDEWVLENLQKEAAGGGPRQSQYIPPAPTRAVLGHSIGAMRYLQPPNTEEPWKMSKFKTVGPKVTQYMSRSPSASPSRPVPSYEQ